MSTKDECERSIRADYQGHVRRHPYKGQVQARENERLQSKGWTHQGSALRPFLFIVLMDVIAGGIDSRVPFDILFADDLLRWRSKILIDEDPKRL